MDRLYVLLWLLACTLTWRSLPRPQLPVVRFSRQFAFVRQPWRGHLALGIRVQVFLLAR
jgi:hypothetical protein